MASVFHEDLYESDRSHQSWARRPIGVAIFLAAAALLAACAFFGVYPGVDLSMSALFFNADTGFTVSTSWTGRAARTGFIVLTDGCMVLLITVLATSVIWPFPRRLHRRAIAFAVLTYLVILMC